METLNIWDNFSDELYFFILKKVKHKHVANDIFQNTFLKIHEKLSTLREEKRAKAWVFQIARNEVINHFNKESNYIDQLHNSEVDDVQETSYACCFDKFINDLPEKYKSVVEMVYINGHKQKDVAKKLEISLENTKARIRRAKDMLKNRLMECCQYGLNKKGNLIGEPNCSTC